MTKPVILTGDRTTGPLHIGHYAGSLRNWLRFQADHDQFLLLADAQALTDNAHDPARLRQNVIEVALDYLADGIDPDQTTICLQSHLPALAELSMLYLNFVSVARLERNPPSRTKSAPVALAATFRRAFCAIRRRRRRTSLHSRPPWCRWARIRPR